MLYAYFIGYILGLLSSATLSTAIILELHKRITKHIVVGITFILNFLIISFIFARKYIFANNNRTYYLDVKRAVIAFYIPLRGAEGTLAPSGAALV